jgi:hypothetical protein
MYSVVPLVQFCSWIFNELRHSFPTLIVDFQILTNGAVFLIHEEYLISNVERWMMTRLQVIETFLVDFRMVLDWLIKVHIVFSKISPTFQMVLNLHGVVLCSFTDTKKDNTAIRVSMQLQGFWNPKWVKLPVGNPSLYTIRGCPERNGVVQSIHQLTSSIVFFLIFQWPIKRDNWAINRLNI